MNWTEKNIRDREKQGKIKGYSVPERKPVKTSGGENVPRRSKSKVLIWLEWNIQFWCNEKALTLEREYKFSLLRNFRSDFAIVAHRILIEFEGGVFQNMPSHTSPSGVQRDITKYSLAQKEGWRIIRLTAKDYKTVLQTLNEMIK